VSNVIDGLDRLCLSIDPLEHANATLDYPHPIEHSSPHSPSPQYPFYQRLLQVPLPTNLVGSRKGKFCAGARTIKMDEWFIQHQNGWLEPSSSGQKLGKHK
jgi:hypothetical protein